MPQSYVSRYTVSRSSLLQKNRSRSMGYALILQLKKTMRMIKRKRKSRLLVLCGPLIVVEDVFLVWCNDLEYQRVWIMGVLLPFPM